MNNTYHLSSWQKSKSDHSFWSESNSVDIPFDACKSHPGSILSKESYPDKGIDEDYVSLEYNRYTPLAGFSHAHCLKCSEALLPFDAARVHPGAVSSTTSDVFIKLFKKDSEGPIFKKYDDNSYYHEECLKKNLKSNEAIRKAFWDAINQGDEASIYAMIKTGSIPPKVLDQAFQMAYAQNRPEFFLPLLRYHPKPSIDNCIQAFELLIEKKHWEFLEDIYMFILPHILSRSKGKVSISENLKLLVKEQQIDVLKKLIQCSINEFDLYLPALKTAAILCEKSYLFAILELTKEVLTKDQIVRLFVVDDVELWILRSILNNRDINLEDLEECAKRAELEHFSFLAEKIRQRKEELKKEGFL